MLSYDTCRIHLLFMVLLFSCYPSYVFFYFHLSLAWKNLRHRNLVLSISLKTVLFRCNLSRCRQKIYEMGNIFCTLSEAWGKVFLFLSILYSVKTISLCKTMHLSFQRYMQDQAAFVFGKVDKKQQCSASYILCVTSLWWMTLWQYDIMSGIYRSERTTYACWLLWITHCAAWVITPDLKWTHLRHLI